MMRKLVLSVLFVLLVGGPLQARTQERVGGGFDSGKWVEDHFGKGKLPPFSFVYGGIPSDKFIRKWDWEAASSEDEDGALRRTVTYSDPVTGLEISCFITCYKDFPATEWYLRMTNHGRSSSPAISGIRVADIVLGGRRGEALKVQYCAGATSSLTDFMPMTHSFAGGADTLSLEPNRGCSSDGLLPFFNISSFSKGKDGYAGLVGGIGWTGTWKANFARVEGGRVALEAGQATFDAFLREGESFRTPEICLMFWKGDNEYSGNNLFRRFVLARKTRKIDGKPTRYPVTAGFNWGAYPCPCNEYTCLTSEWAIGVMRQHQLYGIDPEVYWLDAGWYTTSTDKSWYDGVGDWRPDPSRFPGGLKEVSDEAHRNGKKFLVWFEIERAMPGTLWRRAHPEWMLHFNGRRYGSASEDDDSMPALLDLSRPEVVEWMSQEVGNLMEDNGIDYYRQDFSMPPSAIWPLYDEPGRSGLCEAHYVEGLYKYLDNLFERFPSMLMDNCAAGGRRLDLEMTSRSAPLWRSDLLDNESQQTQTYGLSLFLPQHGTGYTGTDPYSYRSAASSAVHLWPQITNAGISIDTFRKITWEFYHLRDYFLEDFYPLCGFEADFTSKAIWLSYQLDRPSDRSGFVVAFRRPECRQDSSVVKLYGLDTAKEYEILDLDTRQTFPASGESLMSEGLTLYSDQPRSSVLLFYKQR